MHHVRWPAAILAVLLLLAAAWPIGAQPSSIKFDHLALEEGLSQVTTSAILQDHRGFIWIATQDGLNRFDGHRVDVFRHQTGDPTSLADNLCQSLFEDSSGRLWVGTSRNGLRSFYDPMSGQFRHLLHDPDDPSTPFPANSNGGVQAETPDGYLWTGTNQGLERLRLEDLSLRRLPPHGLDEAPRPEAPLANGVITSLLTDRSGTLWVATAGGLHRRLPGNPDEGERFRLYAANPDVPNDPLALSQNTVAGLYEDRQGHLWIGTFSAGLNRLDPESARITRFTNDPTDPSSIASNIIFGFPGGITETPDGALWVATNQGVSRFDPDTEQFRNYDGPLERPGAYATNIRAMLVDSGGRLWLGSQGSGLSLYRPEKDGFTSYLHDPLRPTSLAGDVLSVLFEDDSGNLWIGTNSVGVDRYSPRKHKFRHHHDDPSREDSLGDDMVFAFHEDSQGTVWVGTQGGGAVALDADRRRAVQRFAWLPDEPERDLGTNWVRSIAEDSAGRLWVGTVGAGLTQIDPRAGRVVRRYVNDPADPQSLSHNFVHHVFEDTSGRLWVGTANGWNRFDPETGRSEIYQNVANDPRSLVNNFVRLTYEDTQGNLWLATFRGLSRYEPDTDDFTNWISLPDDTSTLSEGNITDLYDDGLGNLWIATYGGGVDRLHVESGAIEHFNRRHGLPSDAIYSLVPDGQGHFWMSSNHGLTRFDPHDGSLTNFTALDGLQSNEFNGRAFLAKKDGELLFGGVNGFNSFYPHEVEAPDFAPPVRITGLRKINSLQPIFDESQGVEVSYRDTYLSFEFAALDYAMPERTQYRYMLEGLDSNWIDSGSRREAIYTHLDGGHYTFRVKAASGEGVWNEQGASISLVVVPPWWKTWWAYGLYLFTILGAIATYVHSKTKRHLEELGRQRAELEQQRLVSQRLVQIDRMKDTFLANTSHELRTPLNGIIGLAESLLDTPSAERGPNEVDDDLFMIATSGRRLAALVDDILDFSKLKNHQIELQRRAVDLAQLTDVVFTLLGPLADAKGLELTHRMDGLPPADGDENRLSQVLHNLVGNAIKFSEEGQVLVSGETIDGAVEVSVRDRGPGIPEDQLESIFESFEQVDGSDSRSHGGTGLGLTISRQLVELHGGELGVRSVLAEGSTFHFTVPRWQGEVDPADNRRALSRLRRRGPALEDLGTGPIPAPFEAARALGPTVLPQGVEATPAGLPETDAESAAAPTHRGHVLIVDDEPVNLRVLRNILRRAGYRVDEAADGEQCLRVIEHAESLPDLLLLDVMMPRLNGFEVTERLRKRYGGHQLPIILLTAKNQVSDLMQGLSSGANDYLTKPFSRDELLARIRTHLSLSKAHTVAADHRRRSEEMEQARRIQLSMLPDSPPLSSRFEVAVYMKTASEVGGDYYDFFPQDDGSFFAVTGDATGHGISAGMMVSMTKSALKALDVQSPHTLLSQLNNVIRSVHPERMNMALAVAHVSDREIAYSSAAMPPAFLYRAADKRVEELFLPGLPLGGLRNSEYRLGVYEFHHHDALVLFSDGLPERIGDHDTDGYAVVERTVAEHGGDTAGELMEALVALGESHDAEEDTEDDVTVLVIRRL